MPPHRHAVFFTYLYAGAADVYMETGDETLLTALQRLWTELVTQKMYVTGGVSPEHKSHPARSFEPGRLSTIVGDSIHEGISAPYPQVWRTSPNQQSPFRTYAVKYIPLPVKSSYLH
ncbi:MAG: beta-L-arabinofuranosidase domain-containing protein [Planctomycetota bacterium]